MDKEEKATPQTITIKSDDTDESATTVPAQSQEPLNSVLPPPAVAVAVVEPEKVESDNTAETVTATEASATDASQTANQEVHVAEETVESTISEPSGLVMPEPTINSDDKLASVEHSTDSTSVTPGNVAMPALGAISNTSNSDSDSESKPKEPGEAPHEHRNNKKLAIIVTVVVALLLAGAAVYVYLSAQDNATENKNNGSTQSVGAETKIAEPATSAEVDTTSQSVDEAINSLDDSSDFSEDAISDGTLGL